jgi:hypothetical protein
MRGGLLSRSNALVFVLVTRGVLVLVTRGVLVLVLVLTRRIAGNPIFCGPLPWLLGLVTTKHDHVSTPHARVITPHAGVITPHDLANIRGQKPTEFQEGVQFNLTYTFVPEYMQGVRPLLIHVEI